MRLSTITFGIVLVALVLDAAGGPGWGVDSARAVLAVRMDHGAAAPLFLAGSKVQPGLVGRHPSLSDLSDGDVRFHTDFRSVYAAVLDQWLGWPSEAILGERFKQAEVLQG